MRKKVGFMINTEYHLILSILLMERYVSEGYDIYFYRVSPKGGKRLNNINVDYLPVFYGEIIYDYDNPDKSLKRIIDRVASQNFERFFLFLENKFWLNYFFKKLHEKKTIIALAPDGLKVYDNFTCTATNWLRIYLKNLFYCYKTGLCSVGPHVERHYATSKYIDEVWVENIEVFKNRSNKLVVPLKITINAKTMQLINSVFMYDEKDVVLQDAILFLDNNLDSNEYYKRIIEIIKKVQLKSSYKRLYIKRHPLSSPEDESFFKEIEGANFLETKYPAELYIANAKNCTIMAVDSTSLLFYNNTCTYYWLYPMFGDMYDYSNLKNPTKYIRTINNIEEI